MTITELAQLVDGVVEGDGAVEITGLCGEENAHAGDLTFAVDENRLARAEKSIASCVLVGPLARHSMKPLIRVANPKLSFLKVCRHINPPRRRSAFRHPTAIVAESARLGKDVWIGPCVTIEDGVTIGDETVIEGGSNIQKDCAVGAACHIHPNVTLYERTELGRDVVLHGGVVLGSDGFGYVREEGVVHKFPQLGKVVIGDSVEIGANTAIDRGSLGDTVLGSGTKIDNLCQIAHNVRIGKNVVMAAQCGISGSSVIGDDVVMGGQAGVVDNVRIGDGAMIGAKSAVIGNIAKGEVVWGIPARPLSQTKRQMAVLVWLTKHFSQIRDLMKSQVVRR